MLIVQPNPYSFSAKTAKWRPNCNRSTLYIQFFPPKLHSRFKIFKRSAQSLQFFHKNCNVEVKFSIVQHYYIQFFMPKQHSRGQIFKRSSLYTKFLMPKLHSRGQIFNFNRSALYTKFFLPNLVAAAKFSKVQP